MQLLRKQALNAKPEQLEEIRREYAGLIEKNRQWRLDYPRRRKVPTTHNNERISK